MSISMYEIIVIFFLFVTFVMNLIKLLLYIFDKFSQRK